MNPLEDTTRQLFRLIDDKDDLRRISSYLGLSSFINFEKREYQIIHQLLVESIKRGEEKYHDLIAQIHESLQIEQDFAPYDFNTLEEALFSIDNGKRRGGEYIKHKPNGNYLKWIIIVCLILANCFNNLFYFFFNKGE